VSSHIFNDFIAANLLKSLNPLKKNGGDLSVEAARTFSSSSISSIFAVVKVQKPFFFCRAQTLLS
jgi:hypothetical protein